MSLVPHHRIATDRSGQPCSDRFCWPAALALFVSLFAGSLIVFGAGINDGAARKLSDAFMADLIANKVSDAVDLMAPEYIRETGRDVAEARLTMFFDYCGRPVDKELVEDENDVKTWPDGRKVPMKKFYYSSTTSTYRKGNCWFSVGVVTSGTRLKVGEYGAVHQFAGEI